MVWPGANDQLSHNEYTIKYTILYKTEKMIAVRNQRIAEFQLHWSTFEKLFEDC
jgi:hypothetical protein